MHITIGFNGTRNVSGRLETASRVLFDAPPFRAPRDLPCRAMPTAKAEPSPSERKRNPMASSDSPVTIPLLQQMKREGRKSAGVVAWTTRSH